MTQSMSKRIGVTGATGFIGGAICIELKRHGYTVIALDKVKRPYLEKYFDQFHHCDFNHIVMNDMSDWLELDAIIHCAGTSLVGPSIKEPLEYYLNNVAKTLSLIGWLHNHQQPTQLMFSSSASVYRTSSLALKETDPLNPLSPYAKSKHMIETVLQDMASAYGFKSTVFRYFNACGAMNELHGQAPEATHIFPRLFESEMFVMNGEDFSTPDGTCIRDYIHVQDIADAHIKAIEKRATGIINLGSNSGFSNLDIVKAVGINTWRVDARRHGDCDSLIADNGLAKLLLGWTPTYDLQDIVNSLRVWYDSDNYKELKNG